MLRAAIVAGLCALASQAWSAQLFIPLDASGNPPGPVDAGELPEAVEVPAEPETPLQRIDREVAEARYAEAKRAAEAAYLRCLQTERERWLGPDYDRCDAAREQLREYSAAGFFGAAAGCIEEFVLGTPRFGSVGCEWLSAQPVREVRIGVRWP